MHGLLILGSLTAHVLIEIGLLLTNLWIVLSSLWGIICLVRSMKSC